MLTTGYAPFGLWLVIPLACTVFIYALSQIPSKGFWQGFVFGLGWFGAGISWVHVSIADFGGLPLIGSLGLMLLLCGYLALFPALAAYLLKKHFTIHFWPLALPFIWFAVEWLRSWFLTGFPWLSLGYSQIDSPLAGWFPIIGEVGVSTLLVLLAATLAVYLPQKRYIPATIITLVTLLGGWTLKQAEWSTAQGQPVSIAMVQGNIKQELRWVPAQDQPTMEKYQNITRQHWDNDIIIWPEAAVPKLELIANDYLHNIDVEAAKNHVGLITGIVDYNFETKDAFNNLIGLGSQQTYSDEGHYRYGHNNRFSKHHLLPVGEYIPLEDWLRGLAPIFDLPMSSFSRGDYQQANMLAKGYHLAPALCFEIAFPRQIRANLYEHTDFILTVSNDAWFGHSHGPAQHLEIARVRALEFGLPVLRSTNNGITAFIDHKGQIQSRLPQFETGVLSDKIQRVKGNTPYRNLGDLPVFLLSLLLFGYALWLRRKRLLVM